MKKICLIVLLFTLKIHSQEILTQDELFFKDNLIYKTTNSELFTGKIQKFRKKTHLIFEIEYEKGVLKKSILYYNGRDKLIAEETYYYNNDRDIEKKIKYSSDKKRIWVKYFDESGNKKLEEQYRDGKLVYSCPYLKNKKNGIVFSINENGEEIQCEFKNGKLIKN